MIPLVRPATRADAAWVAKFLRPEDRSEIEASSGRAVLPVIVEGVEQSREAYALWGTTLETCEPLCLFGVADEKYLQTRGRVWLVATPMVRFCKETVAQEAHLWFEHWIRKWYSLGLHNLVDTRNQLHMDWIARAGFNFGHTVEKNDVTFQYFSMEGNNV